jgi:DNA invertase Pin-like site-specific DNA recombinase
LDRLGRSLQHLLKLLDELTSFGVGFTSLRDPGIDTTTASGRLLLQLLGAFAEFERNLIRERVVAGVRRAQANGVHCGRPKVELDLRPARALLNEGRAVREVASILGVSRSTLRRRLEEAVE